MQPMCSQCLNFWPGKATKAQRAQCAAFPDGIPEPILSGEKDHRKPMKGDHGLVFVSIEDAPKEQARDPSGPGTGR